MSPPNATRLGNAMACGALSAACRRYQWDVQVTVLRVAASMRERSFRVWVDTEMMSGSTLDAMAAAVENAHCILICITERYKASANCRLEGTYVHEQRKAWVPLMLWFLGDSGISGTECRHSSLLQHHGMAGPEKRRREVFQVIQDRQKVTRWKYGGMR